MSVMEKAVQMHKEYQGKVAIHSKVPMRDAYDLSLAYSPGVAQPCIEIEQNRSKVYDYTMKGNMVGIVTDGTAVLGLGDIGPEAALPVMEGKAILLKHFANVDAFPICLDTKDVDEIVETVKRIAPTFGGINLEDISAPRCFEVEEKLKERLEIPVFHDDQHGTAIVTVSGIINSLKLVNKEFADLKVVLNGPGAAGTAIIKLLQEFGVKDIIACDREGALYPEREGLIDLHKMDLANTTNPRHIKGDLAEAIKGADCFIGVSVAGALTKEMVKTMGENPIVFAMANPVPEIMYDEAIESGVKIMGTGRSDFPNQINNVLAFPGIFKGALSVRASQINEEMKKAAALAIADLITEEELTTEYVIPNPFDKRVAQAVADAVAKAAINSGVSKGGL